MAAAIDDVLVSMGFAKFRCAECKRTFLVSSIDVFRRDVSTLYCPYDKGDSKKVN